MPLLRTGVVDEGGDVDADGAVDAVDEGGVGVAGGGLFHEAEGSGVVASAEGDEGALAIELDRGVEGSVIRWGDCRATVVG